MADRSEATFVFGFLLSYESIDLRLDRVLMDVAHQSQPVRISIHDECLVPPLGKVPTRRCRWLKYWV